MSGSTRIGMTSAIIALTLFGSACGRGADGDADGAVPTEDAALLVTPEGSADRSVAPTVVARAEPTASPTVDPEADPFYPLVGDELPDVPVPIGAERVEFIEATENSDARADYTMADVDDETIAAWFLEQMPEHGWDEGEERTGGGLVFLHEDQISERYASEGLKRTATVIFDTLEDDVDFSLLVEAAAQ